MKTFNTIILSTKRTSLTTCRQLFQDSFSIYSLISSQFVNLQKNSYKNKLQPHWNKKCRRGVKKINLIWTIEKMRSTNVKTSWTEDVTYFKPKSTKLTNLETQKHSTEIKKPSKVFMKINISNFLKLKLWNLNLKNPQPTTLTRWVMKLGKNPVCIRFNSCVIPSMPWLTKVFRSTI